MLLFMITFFIAAIFITIYLRFPQFRILKKIQECKNKKTKQAFYLSLGTNLGVGNLIGVAAAIYMGGSGVIFWMALFAFFASSLAYLENYYAILAQVKTKYGTFSGTCYTIIRFLNGESAKYIALIFSIFLILTNTLFFPPIQINAVVSVFPINYKLIFSIFLIIVILFIVFGGIKRILKITDKFVFIFTIIYFIILVVGILFKINDIKDVINDILINAFNLKCVGVSSFFSMFNIAITKSLFSNEAGLGTMPSVNGIVDPSEVEYVCYFQTFGVIIDTVILCSLTGVFILLYGVNFNGDITQLLKYCFVEFIGKNGLIIYSILISFFGFVAVLGLFYLGENNLMYLVNNYKWSFNKIKFAYQCLFIVGIIVGIFGTFGNIFKLVDLGIIILGSINLYVLIKVENCKKMVKNNHKIT